jgi:hypothetical protein
VSALQRAHPAQEAAQLTGPNPTKAEEMNDELQKWICGLKPQSCRTNANSLINV